METKRLPFAECADGAIGLQTMLAAGLRLVHNGEIELMTLLRALSTRPADILDCRKGVLAVGARADLILLDPDEPFVLDVADLHSRSKNTPLEGARLQGRVHLTVVEGKVVHEAL